MSNKIPISPVSAAGADAQGSFSLQSSPFFNGLPIMLQESILQSNATVQSEDELKQLVDHLYR
ncbi:MAG: hypothetical protein IJW78_05535 [Clostridia bacterium]|nr:hypothetical protein [Clostridia bacterium]MBQ7289167.1 hypothetical protein [Clostridia bacterium]